LGNAKKVFVFFYVNVGWHSLGMRKPFSVHGVTSEEEARRQIVEENCVVSAGKAHDSSPSVLNI
jgi:hypothetical protein